MGGMCSSGMNVAKVQDDTVVTQDTPAQVTNEAKSGRTKTPLGASLPSVDMREQVEDHHIDHSTTRSQQPSVTTTDAAPGTTSSARQSEVFAFPNSEMRVLVCDDCRKIKVLSRWLSKENYGVLMCEDGNEAVNMLDAEARNAASQAEQDASGESVGPVKVTSINLVLVDIEMQTDNGVKVLDYVMSQEALKHIPVVLMSADTTPQAMDRCIRRGGSDFITKPITKQVLLKSIQRTLASRVAWTQTKELLQTGDKYKEQILSMSYESKLSGEKNPYNKLVSPANARHSSTRQLLPVTPRSTQDSVALVQPQNGLIVHIDMNSDSRESVERWLESTGFISVVGFESVEKAKAFILARVSLPLSRPDSAYVSRNGSERASSTKPMPIVVNSSGNVVSHVAHNSLTFDNIEEHLHVETGEEEGLSELIMPSQIIQAVPVAAQGVSLVIVDADEGRSARRHEMLDFLLDMNNHRTATEIPVIVTGELGQADSATAVKRGCDTFLDKPLTKDMLINKVMSHMQFLAQKRKATALLERATRYKALAERMAEVKDNEGVSNTNSAAVDPKGFLIQSKSQLTKSPVNTPHERGSLRRMRDERSQSGRNAKTPLIPREMLKPSKELQEIIQDEDGNDDELLL